MPPDPDEVDETIAASEEIAAACGEAEGARALTRTVAAGGLPMSDALLAMTLLECAFAVTGTEGAVIAQSGAYVEPSEPGQALRVPEGLVAVRLRPERLRADIVERGRALRDGDGARERMIELSGADGRSVHRVRVLSDVDELVIDGLLRSRGSGEAEAARNAAARVPRVFVPWEDGDQLAQIDAVLAGIGSARRARIGSCLGARRIEPAVLPALLEHLCTTQLPLSALVFADGLAQGVTGTVHFATTDESGRIAVAIGEANLDVELSHVHEAMSVRSHGPLGDTSAVELLDDRGRVLVMLTQLGLVHPHVHAAWEDIVASLPAA